MKLLNNWFVQINGYGHKQAKLKCLTLEIHVKALRIQVTNYSPGRTSKEGFQDKSLYNDGTYRIPNFY